MTGPALLRLVASIEGLALLLILVGLVGTTVWKRPRRRRRRQRELVELLTPVLNDAGYPKRAVERLDTMPRPLRLAVLLELADKVTGEAAERVSGLAHGSGVTRLAEGWCRSRRWRRRLRGARTLSVLGGGEAIAPVLLEDRRPEVRAEATVLVLEHPTSALTQRLARMLDDPAAQCRFAAKDALMRLGPDAVEPLVHHLQQTTGHGTQIALEVAREVAEPRLLAAGQRACSDGVPETRARAAELVAAIGGESAVTLLGDLVTDHDARVRAAAVRGLGGLANRDSAPTFAAAMRDDSWEVRRAAALALWELGAQGRLYLRRMLRDGDEFAADMAHLVLDLPHTAVEVWTP